MPIEVLHSRFLLILPRVVLHDRNHFRHIRPHSKADALAPDQGIPR
jgi:hypothetical protein